MVNLVFVPSAVEEAILNLFESAVSIPTVQPKPVAVVKPNAGVIALERVRRLFGVVVPMPTKLAEEINNVEVGVKVVALVA